MTEVDYGGGGHRTRLKDQLINLCLGVPPAPVYKGGRGGGAAGPKGCAWRSPTPTGSRTPSFLVGLGEGEGKGEEEKERGGPRPPSLVQFGLPMGGGATSWAAALSLPSGPIRPITSPGGSGNPSGTPVFSETSPEHFRCPNIVVQYINLYVSTISRLLVMSVITSGTPNNLWYIKMHKLII